MDLSNVTVHICAFGQSLFLRCGGVYLDWSKITNMFRPNGRNVPVNLAQYPIRRFKIMAVGHHFGPSKSQLWNVNLDRQKLQLWTVILDHSKLQLWTIILDRPILQLWTVILDRQKLWRLAVFWTVKKYRCGTWFWTVQNYDCGLRYPSQGGWCPRSRTTQSWTVRFCKFGRSKLRRLAQEAFLVIAVWPNLQ